MTQTADPVMLDMSHFFGLKAGHNAEGEILRRRVELAALSRSARASLDHARLLALPARRFIWRQRRAAPA